MPDTNLDRLLTVLTQESLGSPQTVVAAVEEATPQGISNRGTELISFLFSVTMLRFARNWSASEAASGLSRHGSLDLEESDSSKLSEWLTKALSSVPLTRLARANDLATNYSLVFQDVRILTDVRPVFGESEGLDLLGAVIVNVLRLDYSTAGGGSEELYLALDSDDLDKLEDVIGRARRKGERLRGVLESAGLMELMAPE